MIKANNVMKIIMTAIIFLCSVLITTAQSDIYYSRSATLKAIGIYNGNPLLAQTSELGINLDYETTELELFFNLKKMVFNLDELYEIIKPNSSNVVLKAKLNLDRIETKSHPLLNFTIEGLLTIENSTSQVLGTGELRHINDSGNYVCLLNMTFHVNLSSLNILTPKGMSDDLRIEIRQALLENNKY